MITHLLDTNICIELIRGRSSRVLGHLRNHNEGAVGISTITLAELRFGVSLSSDPAGNLLALARFCAPLTILPFDEHAAAKYGDLRATLQRAGKLIGPLDMLIAAHGLAVPAIVVTNNEREFRRVAGLNVENWVIA